MTLPHGPGNVSTDFRLLISEAENKKLVDTNGISCLASGATAGWLIVKLFVSLKKPGCHSIQEILCFLSMLCAIDAQNTDAMRACSWVSPFGMIGTQQRLEVRVV